MNVNSFNPTPDRLSWMFHVTVGETKAGEPMFFAYSVGQSSRAEFLKATVHYLGAVQNDVQKSTERVASDSSIWSLRGLVLSPIAFLP